MAKRRRVKPYARPTSFDSNVLYDIRQYQLNKYGSMASDTKDVEHKVSGGDEIFHVVEGEILMRKKTSPYYSNGNLHCFSHVNGLSKQEYKDMEYVGVAVTGFAPEREVYEQGFVANFGGLNTLYNNSSSTIKPGDLIVAAIPQGQSSQYQEGVPRAKCQFVPMPFKDAMKNLMIVRLAAEKDAKDTFKGDELTKRLKDIKQTYEGEATTIGTSRIMGTALSYAREKHTFDIILHKAVAMTGIGFLYARAEDEAKKLAEAKKGAEAGEDSEELMSEKEVSFAPSKAAKKKVVKKSAKKN